MNEYMAEYMAFWKRISSNMLGWSDQETESWAKKWADCGDAYSTELPAYLLAEFLIPNSILSGLITFERDTLGSKVANAIHLESKASVLDPDYDWDAARKRVETTISDYMAYINSPAREADHEEMRKMWHFWDRE